MRNIPIGLRQALVALALIGALGIGVTAHFVAQAQCAPWYRCPISQYYGQNQEHGVDILTHGLSISALLPGVVTFDRWECWSGECVMDITWKLDRPTEGQPYAYAQIASSFVHVGERVSGTTYLGQSSTFIEWGLTPDWAYGVSNWRWGANPLPIIQNA